MTDHLRKAHDFFSKFYRHSAFHRLPVHYKRMLVRMIEENPTPVHYVHKEKDWEPSKNSLLTGGWRRVVNVPIPLIYPKQFHEGLWGGEGIIKGFKKPDKKFARKIAHYWMPVLRREIVYSEIFDKYMSVVVTARTMDLIDQNHGFDYYILKTDVIDLRSALALKLKSKMLLSLIHKDFYPDDPEKREEVYEKYKQYIIPEEEAEWLGLTLKEAIAKQRQIDKEKEQHGPLKVKYRAKLIEQLKEMELKEGQEKESQQKSSWISRLNPFDKTKTVEAHDAT